jgi:hypothetical protein
MIDRKQGKSERHRRRAGGQRRTALAQALTHGEAGQGF